MPGIVCGTTGDPDGAVVIDDPAAGLAIDPLQEKLYWTANRPRSPVELRRVEHRGLGRGSGLAAGILLDPTSNRMW